MVAELDCNAGAILRLEYGLRKFARAVLPRRWFYEWEGDCLTCHSSILRVDTAVDVEVTVIVPAGHYFELALAADRHVRSSD